MAAAGAATTTPAPATVAAAAPAYAGFWERFLAVLIDTFIVGAASVALITVPIMFLTTTDAAFSEPFIAWFHYTDLILLSFVGPMVMHWLYEACLLSSEKQATFGKQALRIVVVDRDGRRLSFGSATGRHFGKYASYLVVMAGYLIQSFIEMEGAAHYVSSLAALVGYLIQPFTEKRQALHDMLAGTLVVKR